MAEQPLIDISPENWRIVRDILQRYVPDREVWAFGSRAKWTAKEFSDLDIAIIGDEPLSISLMAGMREAFQESALPFKIDIVDWAAITPEFQKVVKASKVVLSSSRLSQRKTVAEVPIDTLTEGSPITYGVVKPGAEVEGGVLFIRGGDVVNGKILTEQLRTISREVSAQYSRTLLSGGELLISLVGNPGEVALVAPALKGANIARQVGLVRLCPTKVEPDYVQYFLRSSVGRERLFSHSKGSVQQVINLGDLKTLRIPLPPRNEQIAIAGTMRAFDDRIGLLQEANATLEAIAQALFKSWFVDFDPVRAKAEGREPEGVPPEVAELFPSEFEVTELGEIPNGWKVGSFGDYAVLAKGNVNPQQSPNAEYIHYSLPAFDDGQMPVVENGAGIMSNKTIVPDCAILQSKLNPHTPRIWLVGNVKNNAVCSTEFLPWTSINSSSMELIYCILKSSIFEREVMTLVTGTSNSHQRVKADQISRLPLVVANSEINHAFADIVQPILSSVIENRQRASVLGKIRNELLPKLMSGRLTLSESVEA